MATQFTTVEASGRVRVVAVRTWQGRERGTVFEFFATPAEFEGFSQLSRDSVVEVSRAEFFEEVRRFEGTTVVWPEGESR